MKTALFGLTSNLVEGLSADSILLNFVLPSWVLVERTIKSFTEEFRSEARKTLPTNRITTPEDVASLIVYLGSAANSHENGEHIRITGEGSLPLLNTLMREHWARREG